MLQILSELQLVRAEKPKNETLPARVRAVLASTRSAIAIKSFTAKGSPIEVVMVCGRSDVVLEQLGRTHGMPRGFFFVRNTLAANGAAENARYGGFYPKFANDHANGAIDRLDEYGAIHISPKFSGHLGD